MKKKAFVGYAALAIIALLSFEYAFWSNGFDYLEKESEASYLTQAELLRDVMVAEDTIENNTFEEFAVLSILKFPPNLL